MTANGQVTEPPKEKPWQELEEDARRAEATGVGVKTVIDGTTYEVHFGELTGLDSRALRAATGYTTYSLLNQALALNGPPDLDTAAAIAWLARYRAGETALTYDEVLAATRWDSRPAIDLADAVPDAPPEIRDETTGEIEHPQR